LAQYLADDPCPKCGTHLRYRKRRRCVECHRRAVGNYRGARAADKNRAPVLVRRQAPAHHPAILPAPVQGSTISPPSLKQLMAGR